MSVFPESEWQNIVSLCRDAWATGLLWGMNGNASQRLDSGNILITRSGSAKGRLTQKDACIQTPSGETLSGGPASSEGKMHLAIYAACPQSRAVLHCHPQQLLGLSVALGFHPQSNDAWRHDFLQLPLFEASTWKRSLAFVSALPPGTEELALAVSQEAKTHSAIWLDGHGLCTHGATLAECLALAEQLEHLAHVQLHSMARG